MASIAYGPAPPLRLQVLHTRALEAANPAIMWLGLAFATRRAVILLRYWALYAIVLVRIDSLILGNDHPALALGRPSVSLRLAWENRPRSLPKPDRRQSMASLVLLMILVPCVASVLNMQFSPASAATLEAQSSTSVAAGSLAATQAGEAPTDATAPPAPAAMTEMDKWLQAADRLRDRGGDWYNQGVAMRRLIELGHHPVHAAGYIGNFRLESGLIPSRHQYGGGPGRGIAQWEGGRREVLYNIAALSGRPWDDLIYQVDFVNLELGTTETRARDVVRTATDAAQAAVLVRRYYERPNPAKAHEDRRIAYAVETANAFNEELAHVNLLALAASEAPAEETPHTVAPPPAPPAPEWLHPFPEMSRCTSGVGDRWGTVHQGVDMANGRLGSPVINIHDGVVRRAGPASGYGFAVYVEYPGGFIVEYGHVMPGSITELHEGMFVPAGYQLAQVGNEGQSTGPHLHFEVTTSMHGDYVDPEPWLAERGVVLC